MDYVMNIKEVCLTFLSAYVGKCPNFLRCILKGVKCQYVYNFLKNISQRKMKQTWKYINNS